MMDYKKIQKIQIKCRFCEKNFQGRKGQLSCSSNCNVLWHRYKKTKRESHRKKCIWCDVIFNAFRYDDKYCSHNCAQNFRRHQHNKDMLTLTKLRESRKKKCAWCKKPFSIKQASQRCCSQICYGKYYEKFQRKDRDEKARIRSREYYLENRDQIRAERYDISIENYLEITKKCYFCDFKEIIDCHHIVPIRKGGPNILSNYLGLCPNHHKLIHLRKYKLEKVKEKWRLQQQQLKDLTL